MDKIVIEACCGSADDVLEAAAAGIPRVELNSALFLGGLTPSVGEVRVAQSAGISIIAMIRPRQGGFCYTPKEYETMIADAEALLDLGIAGIVFGILHPDGTVDRARCAPLIKLAKDRGRTAVFHRAIDVVPDWKQALDVLIDLGVDRVLTSGQRADVRDGTDTVRAMREYAGGRIEILPGAGVTLENAERIIEETGCSQVHVLLDKPLIDASTSAGSHIHFGGALYPPEDIYTMTDGDRLRQLRERLTGGR